MFGEIRREFFTTPNPQFRPILLAIRPPVRSNKPEELSFGQHKGKFISLGKCQTPPIDNDSPEPPKTWLGIYYAFTLLSGPHTMWLPYICLCIWRVIWRRKIVLKRRLWKSIGNWQQGQGFLWKDNNWFTLIMAKSYLTKRCLFERKLDIWGKTKTLYRNVLLRVRTY